MESNDDERFFSSDSDSDDEINRLNDDDEPFVHPNPMTFNSPHRQCFSLPSDVISYILRNPTSAEGLQKLQKTCKYFFSKSKIIVFNINAVSSNNSFYIWDKYYTNFYYNLNVKFWLNKSLDIYNDFPWHHLQRLYRCTVEELTIYDITMTMNELDFFIDSRKLTHLSLMKMRIEKDDATLVSCAEIIAKSPNVISFEYYCPDEIFTTETFTSMKAAKFNSKLEDFTLFICKLSRKADITLLSDFVKNRAQTHSHFVFRIRIKKRNSLFVSTLESALDRMLQSTWHEGGRPCCRILGRN